MFKEWKYGLHRFSQKEINCLDFPDGILLSVVPAKCSLDSMVEMQKVLYMLQNYSGRFSFEIWRDKGFSFHFFSSLKSAEGMLKGQLNSVYPQVEIKRNGRNLPNFKEGEYVSACTLVLSGVELNLKRSDDFRFEPLRHILNAMKSHDSKILVQVLFERLKRIGKEKRIALEQKFGDDLFFRGVGIPVMKCLVRIVAVSRDGFRARESCEHVARTFSVFDSDRCRLTPKMVSYPVFRSSLGILASVNLREFQIFSERFMVSAPELASMVHLPVGAENCGVEYTQPSLSSSNMPW